MIQNADERRICQRRLLDLQARAEEEQARQRNGVGRSSRYGRATSTGDPGLRARPHPTVHPHLHPSGLGTVPCGQTPAEQGSDDTNLAAP